MFPTKKELEDKLASLDNQLEIIDVMNEYASSYITTEWEYADELVEKTLEMSKKAEYPKGISQALLNKSIRIFYRTDYKSALALLRESEQIMRSLPEPHTLGLPQVLNYKALCYFYLEDSSIAAGIFKEAIQICLKSGHINILGNIYSNLSVLYERLNDDQKALDYTLKCLELIKNSTLYRLQIRALNNAAIYTSKLGDEKKATEYLDKAIELIGLNKQEAEEPRIVGTMAFVNQKAGRLDKAEKLLLKSLELARAREDKLLELGNLNELGDLYLEKNSLKKAEKNFLDYLILSKKYNIRTYEIDIHKKLDETYRKLLDYEKAYYHIVEYFKLDKKSFHLSMREKMKSIEDESLRRSQDRIKIISSIGHKITSSLDLKKVQDLIYQQVKVLMPASLYGIASFNKEKKRLEYDMCIEEGVLIDTIYVDQDDKDSLAMVAIRERRDLIVNEYSKEYSRILPPSGTIKIRGPNQKIPESNLCCPLIVSGEVTGVIIVSSYQKNAYSISDLDSLKALASYVAIALKNAGQAELIKDKNDQLHSAHQQMFTSIKYARKIQYSILSSISIIRNVFSDFFLLFRPRDIVGGDLYWFKEDKKGLLCIIGDCTGHGIPGAFMVMAVNTLLTKVNSDNFFDDPARLLSEINILLKKTLKQEHRTSSSLSDDGADLAVCFISRDRSKVVFAGANQSIYYVQGEQVHKIKGDMISIGYKSSAPDFKFTNHILPVSDGTSYYMTTDGYLDQLGGRKGFPFGPGNFKKLLLTIGSKKMKEQKRIIEKEITAYKGNEKQIDDITLLGFTL